MRLYNYRNIRDIYVSELYDVWVKCFQSEGNQDKPEVCTNISLSDHNSLISPLPAVTPNIFI